MTPKPAPDALHLDRLCAFIVRARRVEAHSLAQDKDFVVEVADVTMKMTFEPGKTRLRTVLPESEEQVESAAARVRPLVLNSEPSNGLNAVNAMAYLLRNHPEFTGGSAGKAIRELRDGWKRVLPSATSDSTPYSVYIADDEASESHDAAALGWAWMYGDVVHSDPDRRAATRLAGVHERYRAGAILTCKIIIQAVATMNVIRGLRKAGLLILPDEPFTEEVAVNSESLIRDVEVWTARHGTESVPSLPTSADEPIASGFHR